MLDTNEYVNTYISSIWFWYTEQVPKNVNRKSLVELEQKRTYFQLSDD